MMAVVVDIVRKFSCYIERADVTTNDNPGHWTILLKKLFLRVKGYKDLPFERGAARCLTHRKRLQIPPPPTAPMQFQT